MAGRFDPSELVKKILALDDGILATVIVDKNGVTLGSAFAESFTRKYPLDAEFMTKAGSWGAIAMGISEQMDSMLSDTEAIVIIRKSIRQVLVPIRSLGILLGLAILRSVDGAYITTKILELVR